MKYIVDITKNLEDFFDTPREEIHNYISLPNQENDQISFDIKNLEITLIDPELINQIISINKNGSIKRLTNNIDINYEFFYLSLMLKNANLIFSNVRNISTKAIYGNRAFYNSTGTEVCKDDAGILFYGRSLDVSELYLDYFIAMNGSVNIIFSENDIVPISMLSKYEKRVFLSKNEITKINIIQQDLVSIKNGNILQILKDFNGIKSPFFENLFLNKYFKGFIAASNYDG